eukprot:11280180-Heterocapsa_arctica.AAC.1
MGPASLLDVAAPCSPLRWRWMGPFPARLCGVDGSHATKAAQDRKGRERTSALDSWAHPLTSGRRMGSAALIVAAEPRSP